MRLPNEIVNVDVLYFDYWTRGIRHFEGVNRYVRLAGLNSVLVHMGSSRGEPGDRNSVISGIKCLDISLFHNDLIYMIRCINPKVVLLLNNQTEDRILVRLCRNIGIKTIFLFHGVVVPLKYAEANAALIDSAFGLKERLSRVPKYARLIVQYLRAATVRSFKGAFDSEIPLYFIRQAFSPGLNCLGKWRYKDACADQNLVYADSDRRFMVEGFGADPRSVVVIGNYNLDRLFEKAQKANATSCGRGAQRYIVYIENGSANPSYNVAGWTENAVADEVEGLARISAEFGYQLVVKLHPSSNYTVLLERIAACGNVEAIRHCDLAELILEAAVVLGQFSSVLMMAVAVRKPIVILDIPPLPCLLNPYGDRKVGRVVCSLIEYREFLRDFRDGRTSTAEYEKVVEESLGPFDGRATERVAARLISLAKGGGQC